ncbi:MAG: hypothetical protein PHC45_05015 [Clostridiaceae bacterium]|nr:hypothetical protein [Clostridiaceae bacterium]
MSFQWDFCLKEKLRQILLSLTDERRLTLGEIAKELGIELHSREDRTKLLSKMYSLKKSDSDIELLMSKEKKYFLAEYADDRMQMHYRYRTIGTTYHKKSDHWLVRASEGKVKEKPFTQLAMDFMNDNNIVIEESISSVEEITNRDIKQKVMEEGK